MIEGYMTINELAEKGGVTSRRIRAMCFNGQISGAAKLGREWAVPSDVFGRVTTGDTKIGEKRGNKI